MKKIIILMCATALLSSCHIYKSYDRPEDITVEGLYRDTIAGGDTLAADTANFGNLPWKEVFTDAQLQTLIEQALTNNADLRSAALTVKQAQAALMSARLAYAPMLALSPQGTVSSFDKGKATQTYSLPVTASWLNPKRKAQVSLKQTQFYEQAVQTQVIANVANMYYTLLMLDRQLQISESTCDILKRNLETVEAMKEAAMANSAAVEQSRTAYAQVLASLPDIRQSIRETENALCLMLNQPAQSIARGTLEQQQLPAEFSTGIPLQLLSNRPDVKAAEMSLAAIGSLTQPLFYRGANIARLKQAKAQEEQAKIQFQTTLLKAGNEVSNALYQYQMTSDKAVSREIQVNSARKAAEDTKELFNLGTSTYLEVLSAEQSYLSAQLSEVADTFDRMQSVISLYQALGGGRE